MKSKRRTAEFRRGIVLGQIMTGGRFERVSRRRVSFFGQLQSWVLGLFWVLGGRPVSVEFRRFPGILIRELRKIPFFGNSFASPLAHGATGFHGLRLKDGATVGEFFAVELYEEFVPGTSGHPSEYQAKTHLVPNLVPMKHTKKRYKE